MTERTIVIVLDGRLDAASVPEFRSALELGTRAGEVSLDLSGLSSIDAAGRACLLEAAGAGVRLEGGSLYISMLLKEVQP